MGRLTATRAYTRSVIPGVTTVAVLGWVALSLAMRPSLVVRFDYQGDSVDDMRIASGMAIEITRQLSQIDGLDVRAAERASPRGQERRSPYTLGVERGTRLVLDGSVLIEAGVPRHVHAALVSVSEGRVLWSRSYAAEDGDAFAVHAGIAASVAEILDLQFRPGRRPYATDPPVQAQFLKARALQAEGGTLSRPEAVELFERITRQAPAFVPAFAALATTLGGHLSISGPPSLNPKIAAAARAAYEADTQLAEAGVAMGLLSARVCEWTRADAYFTEALRLDPSATAAYTDYVISTLLPVGRFEDALDGLRRARAAGPMSVEVGRTLAYVQLLNGDYHDALETSRWVIEQDPDMAFSDQSHGRALYLSRRIEEAHEWFLASDVHWGHRGYALALMGHEDEARALAESHPGEPARQLLIYAGLNDRERAFQALRRTAIRDPWRALVWMRWPEIAPVLRGNPRAASLRTQLLRPANEGGCALSS